MGHYIYFDDHHKTVYMCPFITFNIRTVRQNTLFIVWGCTLSSWSPRMVVNQRLRSSSMIFDKYSHLPQLLLSLVKVSAAGWVFFFSQLITQRWFVYAFFFECNRKGYLRSSKTIPYVSYAPICTLSARSISTGYRFMRFLWTCCLGWMKQNLVWSCRGVVIVASACHHIAQLRCWNPQSRKRSV